MNKFYSLIMTALDSVTEEEISMAAERLDLMNEDTEEVGALPTNSSLVKMWALLFLGAQDLKGLGEAFELVPEGSDAGRKLSSQLNQAADKLESMKALFWAEIREEFNLWSEETIGLRNGFKVVKVLDPICSGCRKRHPEPEIGGAEFLAAALAGFGGKRGLL